MSYTTREAAQLLAVDGKTLARWLHAAALSQQVERDPLDRRLRCIPDDALAALAAAHHRTLPASASAPGHAIAETPAPAQLAAQIAALTARVAALEESARDPGAWRGERLVQQLHKTIGTFPDRSAAARWLARHGVPMSTARGWWTGIAWPDTPADALQEALARRAAGTWRITWHLAPCDDPACVCASAALDHVRL